MNDMAVGQDETVWRDDKTGAAAAGFRPAPVFAAGR